MIKSKARSCFYFVVVLIHNDYDNNEYKFKLDAALVFRGCLEKINYCGKSAPPCEIWKEIISFKLFM